MSRFVCCARNQIVVPLMVAALFLFGGTAFAQDLVVNGTFDNNADGWTAMNEAITVSFRADAGNTLSGGSGPGCLEVKVPAEGGSNGAVQNVGPVTEGVTYTVSGAVFVPGDADNMATNVGYDVDWLDANGAIIAYGDTIFVDNFQKDTWLSLSADVVAAGGAVGARVRPMVSTTNAGTGTKTAVAYFDDISLVEKGATTTTQRLFVPASASAHGRHGTLWTTTGWFANKVAYPVEIKAAFLRQGADNTSALDTLTTLGTVPGGGYLEVQDMVAKLGGAGLTGGIYLEAVANTSGLPSRLVEVTTYTFTPNSNGDGGYGQGVPAVGPGSEELVNVPGIYQNGAYRTNIGTLNTSASTIEIRVEIFAPNGSSLGVDYWTLQPYEHKQVSVTTLGVESASGGYATFRLSRPPGSFQAYATVVDQKTGDAVYSLAR